jgi:hypothetical protein
LKLVSRQDYDVAAEGSGWHGRVAVLALGPGAPGLAEVKPARKGSFLVGVKKGAPCGISAIVATDLLGHRVMLQLPIPSCPHLDKAPALHLTVAQGTRLRYSRVTLQPSRPQTVTLHPGDTLSLTEPGSNRPAFTPGWDSHYLSLIERFSGSSPDGSPQTTWVWLAAQRGSTFTDLSPACRSSVPACGMPDFAVRVTIQ